uniref:Uncharacterized protein n=1 Tax=Arundo donax TaxID=35708 RepID=A0A0A8Z3D0_ARUDO
MNSNFSVTAGLNAGCKYRCVISWVIRKTTQVS